MMNCVGGNSTISYARPEFSHDCKVLHCTRTYKYSWRSTKVSWAIAVFSWGIHSVSCMIHSCSCSERKRKKVLVIVRARWMVLKCLWQPSCKKACFTLTVCSIKGNYTVLQLCFNLMFLQQSWRFTQPLLVVSQRVEVFITKGLSLHLKSKSTRVIRKFTSGEM